MVQFLPAIPTFLASYWLLDKTTNPKRKFRKVMPVIKIKRVQLFPVIRIDLGGKSLHVHHWFYFSIILAVSAFIDSAWLDSSHVRGFLMGGIVQDLALPKARRLIYRHPLEESDHYR